MLAEEMAQEEKKMAEARYREARKDSPFLRIPDVCGILAIGVSDVTVDMIVVYKMMVNERILFWRRKCSGRNPTSLGSGLLGLRKERSTAVMISPRIMLGSCFRHLRSLEPSPSSFTIRPSVSRSDGSRLLHDARTSNAKHMKVARPTQP